MNFRLLIYGFLLFLLGQAIAWIQVYGPMIWPKLKNNMWFSIAVLSPLIGLAYIYATRNVVEAFDGIAWPSRLIGFSAGIIVFALATSFFIKEGINLKTAISLILCVAILLIQIFWKVE
jgi:hypothetical protein